MTRYEFVEGSSRKFWSVSVKGQALTVRYGKIGTEGKELTRTFASAKAAQAEHDSLVREKTRKGYVEVGASAPSKPAASKAASKAAPSKVAAGVWTPRFEAMVAELKQNKKVGEVKATIKPPATDAQLALAAKTLGRPLEAEIAAFYREMNGFDLEWKNLDGEGDGHIHLLPVQEVFGSWKDSIWFEGSPEFDRLHPFDFFIAEACAAFDRSESPLQVHFHYCGEERAPTLLSFTEYLERLLISRGYFYWVHSVTEDNEDSSETEQFLEGAPRLFRGFNKKLFTPKTVDLGSLSLEALLARVPVKVEDEVKHSLITEFSARGPKAKQLLEKALASEAIEDRIRAVRVITGFGAKALDYVPGLLQCLSGLKGRDAARERDLEVSLGLLGDALRAPGLAKAQSAAAALLKGKPEFAPWVVLYVHLFNGQDLKQTPVTRELLQRANDAFDAGRDGEQAAQLINALQGIEAAWQRAVAAMPAGGDALAAWFSKVMELELWRFDELFKARRELAVKHLKTGGSSGLAAARVILERPDDDADQLKCFALVARQADKAVAAYGVKMMKEAFEREKSLGRPKSKFALAITALLSKLK